ncbi:hypothetical protein [Pseudomonas phage UF_RH7]|nr:hypothetical protein [Pseudomonas phage UF_RH7]
MPTIVILWLVVAVIINVVLTILHRWATKSDFLVRISTRNFEREIWVFALAWPITVPTALATWAFDTIYDRKKK